MIELNHLKKEYKVNKQTVTAVSDVTLSLPSTGFVGIVGKSGCGKTTLLNCIGGIVPSTGKIVIDGKNMNSQNKFDDYRSQNIGYIYQDYYLADELTVYENVQMAIDVAKTSVTNDTERIDALLTAVGMANYGKRKVRTLSGGQKQRVAIARALVNNPKIILADEPIAHLDSANKYAIMDILSQLSKHILVLFVSHERDLVEQYSDRIICLNAGTVVSDTANDKSVQTTSEAPEITDDCVTEEFCRQVINIGNSRLELYYLPDSAETVKMVLTANDVHIASDKANAKIVDAKQLSALLNPPKKPSKPQRQTTVFNLENDNVTVTGKTSKRNHKWHLSIFTKKQRVSLIGLVLASVFLALTMSVFTFKTVVNDVDFLEFHKNTVSVSTLTNDFSAEQKDYLKNCQEIEILPTEHLASFSFADNSVLQTAGGGLSFSTSALFLDVKYSEDLLYGRQPQNNREVVLDEMLIEKFSKSNDYEVRHTVELLGYQSIKNYLGMKLNFMYNMDFTVVGISKSSCPAVYMRSQAVLPCAWQANYYEGTFYTDVSLIDKLPLACGQVYISQNLYNSQNCATQGEKIVIDSQTYTVAGTYESTTVIRVGGGYSQGEAIYMNGQDFSDMFWKKFWENKESLYAIATDPTATTTKLQFDGFGTTGALYDLTKSMYTRQAKNKQAGKIFLTVVILSVAFVACWMAEKNNMAQSQSEIVVQRLLGAKRRKIIVGLLLRSLVELAVVALPFYLLSTLLINSFANFAGEALNLTGIALQRAGLGILLLFVIGVVSTTLSALKFFRKNIANQMHDIS